MSIETLKTWFIACLVLTTSCVGQARETSDPTTAAATSTPTPAVSQSPVSDTMTVPAVLADAEKPVAQADTSEDSDGEKKKKKDEEGKRNYKLLIKEPSKLGFEPDEALFRNVYYYIRKNFVEDVPETKLFAGVKSEIKDLLIQAELPTEELDSLDPGRKVLPQLFKRYDTKIDKNLITFAAIMGMLDGLEDRYSLLMLPEDYRKLQEQMQSSDFGGIGIYIDLDAEDENRLTVFEPIEGTPAYKAGLLAGDKVMEIDGVSTDGITLDQAQAKIRGPYDTVVRLQVKRKGTSELLEIPVTRGKIHVVSVSAKMLESKIGYIRLRLFGERTSEELAEAVTKLKKQGAQSLVLDLRNNGGGYIDAAVSIVGQFLQKDNGLVVYTIDRNNRRREYRADEPGTIDLPTLVLVNQFSASASEITAGALRDHGISKLLGVKSFGKGSVQQLYTFPDESALKLTIAKFYTPSGYVINKQGLEADIVVEMEPRYVGRGEKDTQLKAAIDFLKKPEKKLVGAKK